MTHLPEESRHWHQLLAVGEAEEHPGGVPVVVGQLEDPVGASPYLQCRVPPDGQLPHRVLQPLWRCRGGGVSEEVMLGELGGRAGGRKGMLVGEVVRRGAW